jgi:1-acyl-sn-glycerol-3-phosphate acyltransferase
VTARRYAPAYRLAAAIAKPPLLAFTRRRWQGADHLRRDGGFVVAANHLSYVDPLTLAHFLYDNGIPPRFLGKEAVFRIPVLGRIVTAARQIPVYRESADAGRALSAAVAAVEEGDCVVVYPEATLTRDPDLWPMVGKTGAARIALTTGCPVVPVAQWGPQEIMAPYVRRPRLLPRTTVHVLAGPPVDLSEYAGRPLDAVTLRAATDTILDAVALLLGRLRGEQPPEHRWDPREHDQPRIGDPTRDGRDATDGREAG